MIAVRLGRSARMRDRLAPRGARTIRLKLTLLYGGVFLVTGALLLTIGYFLVRHNLGARPDYRKEAQKLGLLPAFGTPAHHPASGGSFTSAYRHFVNDEIRAAEASALHRLLFEYIGALILMTGLSVAAGWLLAGRALAPLRAITATARRVSGENLGERIALAGPNDELKELADTFDGMLARLDRTFASQRHFVASASHELRTPLAIMRTELDVALADPDASVEDLRTMGEAVRETIDRSEALIGALLTIARSEAVVSRDERVDLASLAADCVTDLRRHAEQASVKVRTELRPAVVRGESALLERMIANLIDNGIRHNRSPGELSVRTSTIDAGSAVRGQLVVRNSGAVIDPDVAATLTEPFRRLNRQTAGFGLGLSIVRSVAEAHGGAVEVIAPATGGLEVRVMLPAEPRPASIKSPRRQRTFAGR